MKTCSILGSTGTIGQKALEVAKDSGFEILAITGCKNARLIIDQALKYRPKFVGLAHKESYAIVREVLSGKEIDVIPESEIEELAKLDVNCCVISMAGITNTIIGSTFACLGHAKRLAIASKEPIIIGGKFLKTMAEQTETEILPVDSEHSAIFQCLVGEDEGAVERLILTASGGPFLGLDEPELDVRATIEETLNHPKWNMGSKISVDSATMINKAFEIIEAAILFDIDINRIIPVIHPESVIHGLVEFTDGNVKAVMSPADMNFPISYAMNYPFRSPLPGIRRLDLSNLGNIQFVDQKDWQRKNIDLGYRAFRENKSIAFVVADAVAVDGFLNGKIRFTQIHQIIDKILDISQTEKIESYSDIAMLSDEYCRMVPAAVG